MVTINELRITPDGKNLIIDVSIENLSYYDNVGIAAIIVDSQDTFIPTGPSNRALYHMSYEISSDKPRDCSSEVVLEENGKIKQLRVILTEKDLGVALNDNMFFIYIVTNGTPAPCTPCGMDNIYTLGIAYNLRPLYNLWMNYVRELDQSCTIPQNFIDNILRYKAFELALKTGNYTSAIDYWKRFFQNKGPAVLKSKGCGCHGGY